MPAAIAAFLLDLVRVIVGIALDLVVPPVGTRAAPSGGGEEALPDSATLIARIEAWRRAGVPLTTMSAPAPSQAAAPSPVAQPVPPPIAAAPTLAPADFAAKPVTPEPATASVSPSAPVAPELVPADRGQGNVTIDRAALEALPFSQPAAATPAFVEALAPSPARTGTLEPTQIAAFLAAREAAASVGPHEPTAFSTLPRSPAATGSVDIPALVSAGLQSDERVEPLTASWAALPHSPVVLPSSAPAAHAATPASTAPATAAAAVAAAPGTAPAPPPATLIPAAQPSWPELPPLPLGLEDAPVAARPSLSADVEARWYV